MFDIEDGASMHTNKFKTIQTYVCKLISMSGQSRSDSFIERKYETSHKEVFRSRKLPEVKALLQTLHQKLEHEILPVPGNYPKP